MSQKYVKIEDIKIFRFDIPLRDVFQIALMSVDVAQNVLVKIETHAGIVGWGEASPFHALVGETQLTDFAAAKEIKQLLIGENALEVTRLMRKIDHFLPHNTTIKSAFDIALYDIAAQAANMPLYTFLGGSKKPIETDMTIGICDPDQAGEKALAIKEMGFRIIKVKLGLDFKSDYRRLSNIREAVGKEVVLRIDANQGWDRISAKNNLKAFEAFDIEFCEQPCRANDLQGLKYVSDNSNIPIMADESMFSPSNALNFVDQNITPYFNIKFSKSGGICNAMKMGHIAETGFVPCMIGCMSETKLGLTAAAHFGLSNDIFQFFDLDSHLEHAEDPIIGGLEINNGIMTVPDQSGIGAYPDPDYVNKLDEIE